MTRSICLLAMLLLMLCASPAAASSIGGYWIGFRNFWAGIFASLGGVVGVVLMAGVMGIFIITRGKWLK